MSNERLIQAKKTLLVGLKENAEAAKAAYEAAVAEYKKFADVLDAEGLVLDEPAPAQMELPIQVQPKKVAAPVEAPPVEAAPAKKSRGIRTNVHAIQGRAEIKAGLRPSIKDAMLQVMADKTLNAAAIYEILKEKNWLPNSNDPRAYIAYLLSTFKDRFERVPEKGRGFYRVKDVLPEAKPRKKGNAKNTDKILEEAGVTDGTAFSS